MRVGITGGIGAGKSTVARILVAMNYPVYNSDDQAKLLMNTNELLIEAITERFGPQAYVHHALNRPYIAQKLFQSPDNQKWISEHVHPVVRQHFDQWAIAQKSSLVFQESALLFETGGYKRLDKVIAVIAPEEIRIQRVAVRDNSNTEDVKARISAQVSDEQRLALADFLIHNDDQQLVIPQVLEVLKKLQSEV